MTEPNIERRGVVGSKVISKLQSMSVSFTDDGCCAGGPVPIGVLEHSGSQRLRLRRW